MLILLSPFVIEKTIYQPNGHMTTLPSLIGCFNFQTVKNGDQPIFQTSLLSSSASGKNDKSGHRN